MFFVVTHRSVVVIDTTESMAAALSDFRKISALSVSHLIYATITPTTPARPKPSTLTLLSTIGTLSRKAALLSNCGMPPAKRRITRLSGSRKTCAFSRRSVLGPVFSAQQPDETRPPRRPVGGLARSHARPATGAFRPLHCLAVHGADEIEQRPTTDARSAMSMTKRPDASMRETVKDVHAGAAS
jgi:hypothetical protein